MFMHASRPLAASFRGLPFETGKADFADCLIERIGADRECEYTCSFDKQAASAGMRLIE